MILVLFHIKPMPLTLVKKPFDHEDFFFEIKWDGIRCLTYIQHNKILLKSRKGKVINNAFPEFLSLPLFLKGEDFILDGEICILSEKGHPRFQKILSAFRLQDTSRINKRRENEPATYIVWDLLYLDGRDRRFDPLEKRRTLLSEVVTESPHLLISKAISSQGKALFTAAKEEGLEGIVAKKKKTPYLSSANQYWLKIKCFQYLQACILGYYPEKKGIFLVGRIKEEGFEYFGEISSSLSQDRLISTYEILGTLSIPNPIYPIPSKKKGVVWVKPILYCYIRYLESTRKNKLRQAIITEILGEKPCLS